MSTASHPAKLSLSPQKFVVAQGKPNIVLRLLAGITNIPLCSDMFTQSDAEEYLRDGDARAAIVVETRPPIVAAYSDELDSVILLRIPDAQTEYQGLCDGQKLIAVFNYVHAPYSPRDITLGDNQQGNFLNAEPLIGDLLTDDSARLAELRQEISDDEWKRAEELGRARMNSYPLYRWHRPGNTKMIAGDLWKIIVFAIAAVALLVIGLWVFA